MHFQVLVIRRACGIAPEPTRQMHSQVLAICRACGIAPEPPRQMHFQALAIGRARGVAPEPARQMDFQLARHVVLLGIWGNVTESPHDRYVFSMRAPDAMCCASR